VDGALFVNLDDEDIKDMGITNRFHLRKLELILRSYRLRYERRKEQKGAAHGDGEDEEEEELLSEYAPSELSAIIAAEDARGDEYSAAEDSEEVSYSRPISMYQLSYIMPRLTNFVVAVGKYSLRRR
jgi:hypothetical protein